MKRPPERCLKDTKRKWSWDTNDEKWKAEITGNADPEENSEEEPNKMKIQKQKKRSHNKRNQIIENFDK